MFACTKLAVLFCLGLLGVAVCLADEFPPPPQPLSKGFPPPPEPIQNPERDVKNVEIVPYPATSVPFARLLRDNMLKNLPRELVLSRNDNWGHQAHIKTIQGVRLVEVLRNHGTWEKMTVRVLDLPKFLQLRVDEVTFPTNEDKIAFIVHVDVPANLDFTKQTWQNGVQVYVGHGRAHVRFRGEFVLETSFKQAAAGAILPQEWMGFKIVAVRTWSHDLAAEYVNGMGGDLANMASGNMERTFKHWNDSLRKEMHGHLASAFSKSAGSAEVAIGYDQLMKTIASHEDMTKLLSARTPIRPGYLPDRSATEPREHVILPMIVNALEVLLNGAVAIGLGSLGGGGGGGGGHAANS